MAIIPFSQLETIIKTNPNKELVKKAQAYSKKLKLNVLGQGIDQALKQYTYFESDELFRERNLNPTSNADLYERVLHREEMVFTAKGGSSQYLGLTESMTQSFDALLDTIRFGMTIRKWVKEFALQAYRVDPMGVLFVEVGDDSLPYPTYKCSDCIFDYKPNGRKLEYICFKLTINEVKQFLPDLQDANITDITSDKFSNYYRFVDDKEDRIVKLESGVTVIDTKPVPFLSVPSIIASDIIDFMNNQNFLSPLHKTVELACTFMNDRSIRDQSKKYNGFAKSFEPITTCGFCGGDKYVNGKACPECTPAGADKGLGYKLRTRVADSLKVPLPKSGETPIDMTKVFGYAVPPIEIWNKQDTSLNDIENTITDTYWGTINQQNTTGPTVGTKSTFQETATKTLADLQPVYARLNKTADWAESTENALCNFIGYQQFGKKFKGSARTYGRYYILETPDELMEQYLDMKTKGAPQTSLFDILSKYYHAKFENDPMQLAIKLKLMDVEPFVHQTIVQVQANNPARTDFFMKLYYSEWLATKDDIYLLATKKEQLIVDLSKYAAEKMVEPAELLTPPTVAVADNIRNIA